jgi:hypothetical protein
MTATEETLSTTVDTLQNIRDEIERLTERRRELWHQLSGGRDEATVAEIKRLDDDIAALWDEHRALRARLRFGDRSRIVARARMEERLERAAWRAHRRPLFLGTCGSLAPPSKTVFEVFTASCVRRLRV